MTKRRRLYYSAGLDLPPGHPDAPTYGATADRHQVMSEGEANLVSSEVEAGGGWLHMPVIDIDRIPVRVVPSSTPGNCHLYIDHEVEWPKYVRLLRALEECGIIERGYLGASESRGATFVRKPGHAKVTA